jgi:hypothetical protein
MYSDCHIHCRAGADGNEILRAMDAREMEKAVLIAPHMTKSDSEVVESIGLIEATCAPDPERTPRCRARWTTCGWPSTGA